MTQRSAPPSPGKEQAAHIAFRNEEDDTSTRSADIVNAYFQADPADRLTLLRLPEGSGTEGMDRVASDYLLVKRPIFGMVDSGRLF